MVPSTLFTHYNEEEYNADSGDDTDSEEHCEPKEEPEESKDLTNGNNLAASLHQTIKEALRAAANNRHQQQKKAKLSSSPPSESSPHHHQTQQHPMKPLITPPAHNTFLAPFLLSGGANANSLLMNGAKSADEAATPNPLFTFPFQLNLQQLMESAAMSAQGSSAE